MTVRIIVGTQWGDEGKGKIIDILAERTNFVVRYQGGNNAGHTVVVGNNTFKLHLIPSGILYPACCCVIGNGVVLDPEVFFHEIEHLETQNIVVSPDRLKISSLCHVILPFHKLLDSNQESLREEKIGTTGKGIGPTYTDKVSRCGIRVVDLFSKERLTKRIKDRNWAAILPNHNLNIDEVIEAYYAYGKRLKPFVVDSSLLINDAIDAGKSVILEGAQGTMLDVDHGTYPYVTSSNPVSGGACMGVGIGPHKIHQVIGVTKAYITRVGEGPFPSELDNDLGEHLRQRGAEFGTTTGRPRRCGWLDLVVLRYAARINGITEICLTKLDVLDGLDEILVCNSYDSPEGVLTNFPHDLDLFACCKPIYESFPGWTEDISGITDFNQLPENAKRYIRHIEETAKVKVTLVSVGSRRNQTIHLLTR